MSAEVRGLSDAERLALGLVRVGWLEEGVDCALETVERIVVDRERAAEVRALREFADTRGVNVGDEDDEWWRGYRQAQRECLSDALDRADRIEADR